MSLRLKILILILGLFIALDALAYGMQSLFILPSFQELEKEEAIKNMDRVTEAINREIQSLGVSVHDWASWDDTYEFAMDKNKKYLEDNLNAQALGNLEINLLYIFDSSRNLLWGQMYDLQKKEEFSFPDIFKTIHENNIFSLTDTESKVDGLIMTSNGPLFVSARPILTGFNKGPSHGTLVLGRFLNATSLAEQTRVNLGIQLIKDLKISEEDNATVKELQKTGEVKVRSDSEHTYVHKLYNDLFGKPCVLLSISMPKIIYFRGKTAINFAAISLIGTGMIIMLVLLISLRIMILQPMHLLTEHTLKVGKSGNLTERLNMNRRDEFGLLSSEFNRMVEKLAETRKTLSEQSYQSGLAEMARGVLHNIGNAITPLGVKLVSIRDEFVKAPVEEMEMATTELDNPSIAAERRADLSTFMELAGMSLGDTIKTSKLGINDALKYVDHIQRILADQHRISRTQRVIEELDMTSLLSDAINLIPESIRKSVDIKLDTNISHIDKIYSNKIAIEQVINNLLINAYESVSENSRRSSRGTINIHASRNLDKDTPMLDLSIEDNGIGIPEENLNKLFTYGFSTKGRGSGMGLHWCANTILALKGSLYAESKGPNHGAIFHMLLPFEYEVSNKKEKSNEQ